MNLMRDAASAMRSLLLRASVRYHGRVVAAYWNSTTATHHDMSDAAFTRYADAIAEMLGPPAAAGLVLDYAAGSGEIGTRLAMRGYRMEFAEFAPHFVRRMRDAGLVAYASAEVPDGRFDTVFANNAMYYVHPRTMESEIRRLLDKVKPRGRLLILDVPVIERVHRLAAPALRRLVWHATRVYQPMLGGFFMDARWLLRQFPGARVSDSWSDYRVHFEIPK